MSRLLCIDFDSFFVNPMDAGNFDDPHWQAYDWGHAEAVFFINGPLWQMRADTFARNGIPLPMASVPAGDWEAFWSRFTFTDPDGVYAYAADSNAHAGTLRPGDGSARFESVLLFDAHHDSGYHITSMAEYEKQATFSCEGWMLEHQHQGVTDLEVRYPGWNPGGPSHTLPQGVLTRQRVDDGMAVAQEFDTVFACRSGAWVPPWCDDQFEAFLDAAPFEIIWMESEPRNRGWQTSPAAQTLPLS